MNSLENKINKDFLTQILMEILKNSQIDEECDMVNKHIEICINDLEYEYKYKENLRNELIDIVETYIQYGQNSIDFYKTNQDLCRDENFELYETGKYLENKYDPKGNWDFIKKDLKNLVYTPLLFNNNVSQLKYRIRLNMKDDELKKWENIILTLEKDNIENIEDFIRASEELITEKLTDDDDYSKWEEIKTNLRFQASSI